MHFRQIHPGEAEETDVAFGILIVKIAIRDVSSGIIFDGFSAGCRLVDVRFAPKRLGQADLPDTGKSVCDFSDPASIAKQ